eukprot:scaffold2503_cov301-Prasinococcus_capsulatus_cf.AAC.2
MCIEREAHGAELALVNSRQRATRRANARAMQGRSGESPARSRRRWWRRRRRRRGLRRPACSARRARVRRPSSAAPRRGRT